MTFNRRFAALSLLVFALFNTRDGIGATSEPYCSQKEQHCTMLLKQLQGKWILEGWGTDDQNSGMQQVSSSSVIIKLYWEDQFFYFNYGENGHLYESYGGRLKVIAQNQIEEQVDFYSPFDFRQIAYGEKGQMVIVHGESMVGAQIKLKLEISGNSMMQSGRILQRVPIGESKAMFGPRTVLNRFRKETNAQEIVK